MTVEPRTLPHVGDDEALIARLNDATRAMHRLPEQVNESVLRWLQSSMRSMRRCAGRISPPVEASAGRPFAPTDAPGLADAGSDIASSENNGNPATTTKG